MRLRLFVLALILGMVACQISNDPQPRPRLYPRIQFPERLYVDWSADMCPFSFELPSYAKFVLKTPALEGQDHPCWFNIIIPGLGATIFCSYFDVLNQAQYDDLINDAYTMVSKHNVKASFREDIPVQNTRGYKGQLFRIEGEVASPYQFYITDETQHFLRGSLYFEDKVMFDSLQPIIQFVQKDIEHLLATIEWK